MKLVRINWVDSALPADNGWRLRDDVEGITPGRMSSVGYVISETKRHVTIAAHVSSGGCVYGVLTIPKVAVTKRVTL